MGLWMTTCYRGGFSLHLHIKIKIDTKRPDITTIFVSFFLKSYLRQPNVMDIYNEIRNYISATVPLL